MKTVYILLVLVIAASVLGCVGKKGPESTTRTPVSAVSPTPVSPAVTSIPPSESDEFGLDNDLTQMDSMFDESSMDISLVGDFSSI